MAAGQWVSRQSLVQVAQEFGVTPHTVEAWATSASRIIRASVSGHMEDIRARMLVTLEGVIAEARAAKKHKEAIQAVDTYARLLGIMVQRHELKHMTEEEADKLLLEAAELAKERT